MKQQGATRCWKWQITQLATTKPQSLDAMVDLPGIGQAKLNRYGKAFLAVLTGQAT